ncbi:hypothetical protein [Bradyrhizobium sp. 2TAF24]|uniref:hypothetical protein n=1 Tax=Bradyrhizobium sp. 2TAF24 TaxID=3233011 RepID=UPI003F92E309
MIKPIECLSVEVIPQAIISLPVDQILSGRAKITQGVDDLDHFEGASFRLDNGIEVAVRHYRGHPKDTATIYIDSRQRDVERITHLVRRILRDLHVPLTALSWERQQNPEM